jgi:hypothetical protein
VSDTGDTAPTLFPLEPSSNPVGNGTSVKPTRAPARRLSPTTKAALAEIRRELVTARELLEELARPRADP